MRGLLAGLALFTSLAAVPAAPIPTAAPASFSIVLEATPTGWAARCDSGCSWQKLSFACQRACGALVDVNGMVTSASYRPDSSAFMFLLEHAANNGGRALARGGTAWTALAWECGPSPCRVRIDGHGVSRE